MGNIRGNAILEQVVAIGEDLGVSSTEKEFSRRSCLKHIVIRKVVIGQDYLI